MYVCICNAVTERDIGNAVAKGCCSLQELREQLGVGACCDLPNLQALNKLIIGENVPECLAGDLKLEHGAHADTKAAIAYCESVNDYVSREILEDILEDTEEHIDHLETQLELIEKVGVQNYLQSAMGGSSGS